MRTHFRKVAKATNTTQRKGFSHDIISLFCDVDDFCIGFEPLWRQQLLAGLKGKVFGDRGYISQALCGRLLV